MRTQGLVALALLTGCATPIAGGLDEGDANRIVIALDRASIEATKETDPAVEGKFHVTVQKDDAARAITTLQGEELPRPRSPGVLDAIDKGALVPSAAQEHAQLVAGTAGDLERTLESIDGVLTARVHLSVPSADPLSGAPPGKTTASVLIEHRGVAPPVVEGSVARLVAGGVPGLAPADVAVVMVGRPAPVLAAGSSLAHVGPITVAHASMRLLQVALVGLLALVAALTAATLALFAKVRKLAAEAEDSSPGSPSPARP
jgi:type III secretion protein J